MSTTPRSPRETVANLTYFARMLDKIRLHARGELNPDLHANLGQGVDGFCCGFLHIGYEALKARVAEGGSDEEILAWCQEHGRALNETDKMVWNAFAVKLGWNDRASEFLREFKSYSGLAGRDDIQTMADYIDVDEGRKP